MGTLEVRTFICINGYHKLCIEAENTLHWTFKKNCFDVCMCVHKIYNNVSIYVLKLIKCLQDSDKTNIYLY